METIISLIIQKVLAGDYSSANGWAALYWEWLE
jgi:hypothetical protein